MYSSIAMLRIHLWATNIVFFLLISDVKKYESFSLLTSKSYISFLQ